MNRKINKNLFDTIEEDVERVSKIKKLEMEELDLRNEMFDEGLSVGYKEGQKRMTTFVSNLCDYQGMICPNCGYDYLHQCEVKSIFRNEDKDGIEVNHTEDKVLQKTIKSEYIWGRRDVCDISFTCEGCWETSTLRIAQHKGQTFIGWL